MPIPPISEDAQAPALADAGPAAPPLDELSARHLLDKGLREAGYRIVNDHPLQFGDSTVTLDGYDPAAKVGYEYVDPSEEGLRAPAGLGDSILWLEASDQEALERELERFMEVLASSSSDVPPRSQP